MTGKIKHYGFTLAEVLITLGIIGVVAAMTLPTVINNTRNKQNETALKKAYSIAQQALAMMAANYGDVKPENFAVREFVTEYIKNFNNAIDCGIAWNATAKDLCVSSGDIANYKNFNNTTAVAATYFDDGQFVLIDGALVLIENASAGQLFISVDVNGYGKRPNRLGQDLFMFEINDKGALLPMGVAGTFYYGENNEYCNSSSTNSMNGAGCTYKALNEKDYFNKLPK